MSDKPKTAAQLKKEAEFAISFVISEQNAILHEETGLPIASVTVENAGCEAGCIGPRYTPVVKISL